MACTFFKSSLSLALSGSPNLSSILIISTAWQAYASGAIRPRIRSDSRLARRLRRAPFSFFMNMFNISGEVVDRMAAWIASCAEPTESTREMLPADIFCSDASNSFS